MVAVGEAIAVVVGADVGVDTLGVLVVVAELLEVPPGKPVARK